MEDSGAYPNPCDQPNVGGASRPLCRIDGPDADPVPTTRDRTLLVVHFAHPDHSTGKADSPDSAHSADSAASAASAGPDLGAPTVFLPNRCLASTAPAETWFSDFPAQRGRVGRVAWADNGCVLFGGLASPLAGDLAGETEAHFTALLDTAEARGFPYLLRVWNFLPGINAAESGTERYRLFNSGRAAAFDARYGVAGAEARFSASSAVGSSGDRLRTFFVAARSPGRHLGNPRQVHAFRYPADYGPRPPSFTRATISPPELGQVLFLSGTASIAGHETRHAGQLLEQLEETLHNIEVLLAASSEGAAALPGLEEFDQFRIYLRDAADLELVRDSLLRRVGKLPALQFVEADICRTDLLLEIEGIAGLPRAPRLAG